MIIDEFELKRRYLKRIEGVRDKQVYIGPEIVTLDIINACNLNCRHCWTHSPGNPLHFEKARFFPWERFLGIVRDSVELKVDEICMVGSGEPTLHPQFREMMQHLGQQPLRVRLLTNATFPLDYCFNVIKADRIVIDLSAVERQQYQDIQGKDLFDRVVSNIRHLVSLRDSQKPGFQIEIAYIVNALNVDQKQRMREMASQLGVDTVHFSRMNVNEYNKEIALPGGLVSELEGEFRRTPQACLNGWFEIIAKLEGNTSTCCRVHRMPLDDLDKVSLKELWHSSRTMNVRLLGKYGHIQKMYKACQTCPLYEENNHRSQVLAGLEGNFN